jgi:hypothetical protein
MWWAQCLVEPPGSRNSVCGILTIGGGPDLVGCVTQVVDFAVDLVAGLLHDRSGHLPVDLEPRPRHHRVAVDADVVPELAAHVGATRLTAGGAAPERVRPAKAELVVPVKISVQLASGLLVHLCVLR